MNTNLSNAREFGESPLEVEQKYRVASHEVVLECLCSMNAIELPHEKHCDTYLKHPSRDFAMTGEALRIREINDSAVITYKGARLEGIIKIRPEIEIPLVDQSQFAWMQIWMSLGFHEVAKIQKRRRSFELAYETISVIVALDDVTHLGKFVEIESIVHDRTLLPSIQDRIVEVARQLKVDEIEPRSYLRQLLEKRQ